MYSNLNLQTLPHTSAIFFFCETWLNSAPKHTIKRNPILPDIPNLEYLSTNIMLQNIF